MRLSGKINGVETNFRLGSFYMHFILARYITTSVAQWQRTDEGKVCLHLWVGVIHELFYDLL